LKRTAFALTIIWAFLASLVCFQFVSFVDASEIPAYSVHVSIQSPNGSYSESTLPLIVNSTLYIGTDAPPDEVSLQNVTCNYSLDNGEWKNVTSMRVTSHTTQPDINFWSGLLHVINCTYNTTLQDLSEGSHLLNVTVKSDDNHQGSSSVYFTVVKTEITIYIRADGSVDPSLAAIQRDGNVYTFTDNIIEQKIVVERDNIIIDGANFRLHGKGAEVGIDITYRNNVTIKNIQIIGAGIHLVGANNNTIFRNLIANNHHGIGFYGESNYNKIIGNTLMDNERGIYFSQSYNNSIYDNSFINNTRQVYDIVWEQPWYPQLLSVNFWDNGTTGNYWSNYNGTDDNGDGIGDIPYVIDQNNQDNYPLMEEFIIPEFPSWTPLLIMLFSFVVIAVIYRCTLHKATLHKANHRRRVR
jgi:parallel beta-helix repeat protein